MTENKRINKLNANGLVIVLLTAVMALAVIFGGMTGIITAKAVAWGDVPECDEIEEFWRSYAEEKGLAVSTMNDYTELLGQSPYGFSILCNVNENDKLELRDNGFYLIGIGNMDLLYIPKKSPFGEIQGKVLKGVAFAGGWNLPLEEYNILHSNGKAFRETENFYVACVLRTDMEDFVYGRNYITYVYEDSPISPLPDDPVKEGHRFVGWYFDEALTRPYDGSAITEDTQLYAKFEIYRYTVKFDSNGGAAVANQTVDWNTAVNAPTLEREGYTFLGWYDGDVKYEGQAVTENMTLTAKWEVKKCTVIFHVDGQIYKTVVVNYGTTFQDVMTANEELFFMNLLNDEGVKISKSAKVTNDVSVPIGNMTREEKVAAWIGNNWWVLYLAGGLILAGVAATAIASVVAHKRR